MMTPEAIQTLLTERFPGAVLAVEDMTGTQDHFEIRISWEGFRGKGLMEQHKIIHDALGVPLESGLIHALKIKTLVPDR